MSWIVTILSDESREVGVAACYFVARELKQLTIPADLRKDPLADAEASLPTPQARAAAERIIQEIERREQRSRLQLSKETALHYVDLVLDAGHDIARNARTGSADGARLLAELRSAAGAR
jgi:hypothetical protein